MAEEVRRYAGQTITDGWIGYLVRPLVRAGWRPGDPTEALDHAGWGGMRHRYALRTMRNPRAVAQWRLRAFWADADGNVLPSPSQRRAAAAAQARQEAEPLAAAAQARPADPRPHLTAIFAAQGWALPRPRPARGGPPEEGTTR